MVAMETVVVVVLRSTEAKLHEVVTVALTPKPGN